MECSDIVIEDRKVFAKTGIAIRFTLFGFICYKVCNKRGTDFTKLLFTIVHYKPIGEDK